MRTFALIPAAGKSTRMGRPKLALPLGDQSVLQRVLHALRPVGLSDILVVLGPHVAGLSSMVEAARAHALVLKAETPDMRATVAHGLEWLEERHQPEAADAFLLCPADHPTLDGTVAQRLIHEASAKPHAGSIWIPTFGGRRGHPALVLWQHVKEIRLLPAEFGLNHYFRARMNETIESAWHSPDILMDLDTPEDYERLRARFGAD